MPDNFEIFAYRHKDSHIEFLENLFTAVSMTFCFSGRLLDDLFSNLPKVRISLLIAVLKVLKSPCTRNGCAFPQEILIL